MGKSALERKADELLTRAMMANGRPSTAPEARQRKKKWISPGPGAYDIGVSQEQPVNGGMGRHGARAHGGTFGTSARYDPKCKVFLGAGHNKTSAMFGHQSPGPATYNTRKVVYGQGAGRFGNSILNRSLAVKTGGGSVEFVNLSGNKHGAGRSSPAFSMGSGHKPINNTSIVSPGPCYKPDINVNRTRMASYTFRGGKLRGTEKESDEVLNPKPGPGNYDHQDYIGPGTGAAEYSFGTGKRPPLNNSVMVKLGCKKCNGKGCKNGCRRKVKDTPAPNHYGVPMRDDNICAGTRGRSAGGARGDRGGKWGKDARFKQKGDADSNTMVTPGPGTYESHKHLSIDKDATAGPTMGALSDFAANAAEGRAPGPGRYEAPSYVGPGTGVPEYSFGTSTRPPLNNVANVRIKCEKCHAAEQQRQADGRLLQDVSGCPHGCDMFTKSMPAPDQYGQDCPDGVPAGNNAMHPPNGTSFTMGSGWGPNPDKQFITKMHQNSQMKPDTPGPVYEITDAEITKTAAPAYSWGFGVRPDLNPGIFQSPGPIYDVSTADRLTTRHDRQVKIATRERWENEDDYKIKVFAGGGSGPAHGLDHMDAGVDGSARSFSFSKDKRFEPEGAEELQKAPGTWFEPIDHSLNESAIMPGNLN